MLAFLLQLLYIIEFIVWLLVKEQLYIHSQFFLQIQPFTFIIARKNRNAVLFFQLIDLIENGRPVYTTFFVVIIMLAAIDLVFALDSIPAVMGISQDKLVIYTSNIFAVLGLRSLFFLLRGAVSKFDYLQQGIAIVLVFIGIKMLAQDVINKWVPDKTIQVIISLGVILVCISGSIFYSIFINKRGVPPEVKDNSI